MDPTQGHTSRGVVTLRLASLEADAMLREARESLVVALLGSAYRLDPTSDGLRIVGPGSSGTITVRLLPAVRGLATLSISGAIDGRPGLPRELEDRLLRVASRHTTLPPTDAYCHSLAFGRECDRRQGHSGHHLSVAPEPVAWRSDGTATVPFDSRFVIEDLLERIRTLEKAVAAGAARPSTIASVPGDLGISRELPRAVRPPPGSAAGGPPPPRRRRGQGGRSR